MSNFFISGMVVFLVLSLMIFFGLFFDLSDFNIFNFNIDGLNFGSYYGVMEFGMLGYMLLSVVDILL